MPGSQYQNIFFYFRGPTAKTSLAAADKQIEDNTTKALINLLRYSEPGLADSWLESLQIPSAGGPERQFFLQGGPQDPWQADSRFLVVITAGAGPGEAIWEESESEEGRVDAALYAPGEQLVVIESKVAAELHGGQLMLHASDWRIPVPDHYDPLPEQWRFTTWTNAFLWGRAQLARAGDPITRFLLGQFCEYLAILGLAPVFAGFRPEDFEYLEERRAALERGKSAPIDVVQGTLIKDRLAKLWQAALKHLSPAQRAALGEIHVGALREKDDHLWAASNWGQKQAGVNLNCHLGATELQLNLEAWKTDQAARFESQLARLETSALEGLDGFSLVLWRRRAVKSKAGNPFWMQETSDVLTSIPIAELGASSGLLAEYRSRCEPGWERLAYHLLRTWPAERVVQAGESLAIEVANQLVALIPLMRSLNGLPAVTEGRLDELAAERLTARIPGRSLSDLSYALRFNSNREPERWQFVADGPSIMVPSPNGMHLRGMTFHIAIAPAPTGEREFVACAATRAYASGGADGTLDAHYRGPSLARAIEAINRVAASWMMDAEEDSELQPAGRSLNEEEVIRALKAGERYEGGAASELDQIAQARYERFDGWPGLAPLAVLYYSSELVG